MPQRLKEAVISLKKEHVFRKTHHVFRIIEVSQRETHSVFCIFGRFCGSQVSVEACFSRRPLGHAQKWWVSMWEKMAKYIRLGVVLSCPYWLHVILSAWHCLACPYFDLAPHWRLPHDEISCLTPMKGRLVFLHLTTLELKGGLESAWNQLGISLESACAKRWRSLIGSVNDPSCWNNHESLALYSFHGGC